jgi:hypothetical protein
MGCKVYQPSGTSASITGDGSWQVWSAFSGEAFNVGSMHEAITNPARITIPTAGKYLLMASMFIPCKNPSALFLRIRKNGNDGTTIGYNGNNVSNSGNTQWNATSGAQHLYVASLESCSVADYYEVQVFSNDGVMTWVSPSDSNGVRFEAVALG